MITNKCQKYYALFFVVVDRETQKIEALSKGLCSMQCRNIIILSLH